MRNVVICGEITTIIPNIKQKYKVHVSESSKSIYVANGKSIYVTSLTDQNISLKNEIKIVDIESDDFIIYTRYIEGTSELLVFTSQGSIYSCVTDEESFGNFIFKGSTDSKIIYLAFNPTFTLFAVYTESQKILLMSSELDEIAYFDANPREFGEGQNVSLGWGSKDTQFLGQGKKLIKSANPQELSDSDRDENLEIPLSWKNEQDVCISWRQDGEYFAVSSFDPIDGWRKIRIWTSKGILHSTTEKIPNLLPLLCWNPMGNWLASIQIISLKEIKDVGNFGFRTILLEKNGLKRHHFDLFLSEGSEILHISDLCWDLCHDLFCFHAIVKNQDMIHNTIFIYKISNFHWYLKMQIPLNVQKISTTQSHQNIQVNLSWLLTTENICSKISRLSAVRNDGCFTVFEMRLEVSRCKNDSTVAVVDAEHVMVTELESSLVPPPYCSYCAKTPFIPICNAIAANSSETIFTFSHLGDIMAIITLDKSKKEFLNTRISSGCEVQCINLEKLLPHEKSENSIIRFRFCCAISQTKCYLIYRESSANVDMLCEIFIKRNQTGSHLTAEVVNHFKLSKTVNAFTISRDGSALLIEFTDSSTLIFKVLSNSKNDTFEKSDISVSNSRSHSLDLVKIESRSQSSSNIVIDEYAVIKLCGQGKLWINSILLCELCDFFIITASFLFVTSKTSKLFCYRLFELWERDNIITNSAEVGIQCYKPDLSIDCREIELGSTIISSGCLYENSSHPSIFLQMPRGNLECIHPRPLVLTLIETSFKKNDFVKALLHIRKYRIDPNIMFQLPPLICDQYSASYVVKSLDCDESITYLVSNLKTENVLTTLYNKFFRDYFKIAAVSKFNISKICAEIRCTLQSLKIEKFVQSILLTFLKEEDNENVENCLKCLLKFYHDFQWDVNKLRSMVVFLLRYVDSVELLYKRAFATYDFRLIVIVAQVAQKDPLDYESLLKSFYQHPIPFRYFLIDCHLEKYHAALKHILCDHSKFPECIEFVKKYEFYLDAIEYYQQSHESEKMERISQIYAEYLGNKKKYKEAALYSSIARNYSFALNCCLQSGNWNLAQSIGMISNTEFSREYLNKFVDKLEGENKYSDCAFICHHMLKDEIRALEYSIKNRDWLYALKLASFIETNLQENVQKNKYIHILREAIGDRVALIKESSKRFCLDWSNKVDRLALIRKEKEALIFSGVIYDSVSECEYQSSSFSSRSNISTTSSKKSKQKKEQNKFFSSKEGGVYEEFALMNKISQMLESMKKDFMSDSESLNSVMTILNQRDLMKIHSHILLNLKDLIIKDYHSVWLTTCHLGPVRKGEMEPVKLANIPPPLLSVPTLPDWPSFF